MGASIRKVDYFSTMVRDQPGEGYTLMARLAAARVNLLAFNAIPSGLYHTQLILFADDVKRLRAVAEEMGLQLAGPDRAFLIQGDDELGALAGIHRRLFEAGVNVCASTGVTDGRGGFGYIIHVRDEDFNRAAVALGV